MQTTLITGASSGLGAALARYYAAEKQRLLLTGRDEARLKEVHKSCEALGALVVAKVIDVTDKDAMQAWIEAEDAVSPISRVIANAGISAGTLGGGENAAQVRQIFATNIDGVLNTIVPLTSRMCARKSGHIVLISSLAGFRGLPSAPSYSASKAAVRVYGEGLRGSLQKEGVHVTVVTPGYIATPMTDVNDFYMPWKVPVEKAAHIIGTRLEKYPARIAFPWQLYAVVLTTSWLPLCISDALLTRLPGKKALP